MTAAATVTADRLLVLELLLLARKPHTVTLDRVAELATAAATRIAAIPGESLDTPAPTR